MPAVSTSAHGKVYVIGAKWPWNRNIMMATYHPSEDRWVSHPGPDSQSAKFKMSCVFILRGKLYVYKNDMKESLNLTLMGNNWQDIDIVLPSAQIRNTRCVTLNGDTAVMTGETIDIIYTPSEQYYLHYIIMVNDIQNDVVVFNFKYHPPVPFKSNQIKSNQIPSIIVMI